MEPQQPHSSSSSLMVGCRFSPTDRELLFYYLWAKVHNESTPYCIKEIDIYAFHPQQLFDMYAGGTGNDDQESEDGNNYLYFFTKIKKMKENGTNASRSVAVRSSSQPCQETVIGTWKGQDSGKHLNIVRGGGVVRGMNRSFSYQSNNYSHRVDGNSSSKKRNPNALCKDRIECSYIMHEYSLVGIDSRGYVLCKIRRKYDKNKIMSSNKKNNLKKMATSSSRAAAASWEEGQTSNRTRLVNRPYHHQEQVMPTSQRNLPSYGFMTINPAQVPCSVRSSSSAGRTRDEEMTATESCSDNTYYHQDDVVAMNSSCTSGKIVTAPHYHQEDVTAMNSSCTSDTIATTALPPVPSPAADRSWDELGDLPELLSLDEKTDGLLSTAQSISKEELINSYISNPYHHQAPAMTMNDDWQQRLTDNIMTEASVTASASGGFSSVEAKTQSKQTGGSSLASTTMEEETGRISSMSQITSDGKIHYQTI